MLSFSALPVLALAWSLCFWQFFLITVSIPYLNNGLYLLGPGGAIQYFYRDFVTDHKVSVELRYSEFLGQSNTYNLCFLKIAHLKEMPFSYL